MTLTVEELKAILSRDDTPVIDIRLVRAFALEHIAGTHSVPFRQDGWVASIKAALSKNMIVLFGDNPRLAQAARQAWEQSGGTVLAVWDQGLGPWKAQGEPTVAVKNMTVDTLAQQLNEVAVIDVREPYEWRSGVIPGAKAIPLGTLVEHLGELPKDRPYVVVCAHGNRSLTGAAFLADQGYDASSLLGGMALWLGAAYPVDRSSQP